VTTISLESSNSDLTVSSIFYVPERPPPSAARSDKLDIINRLCENVSHAMADLFETLITTQNIDGRLSDGPRSRSLAYLCHHSLTDDEDGRRQAKEAFKRDCKDYLGLDNVQVWNCSIVSSRCPGRTTVEVLVPTATADLILCRKSRLPQGTTIGPWLPIRQRRLHFELRKRQYRASQQHGAISPLVPGSQPPTSHPPGGASSSSTATTAWTPSFGGTLRTLCSPPRINKLKRTVMLPMNHGPALKRGESGYIGAKFDGGAVVEVRKRFGGVQGNGNFVPVANETDPLKMVDLVKRFKRAGDDSWMNEWLVCGEGGNLMCCEAGDDASLPYWGKG
jgi:hypothetical protein